MSSRQGGHRRTVGVAVGATLLLVVFVVGLAFANSIGAGRVAANARSMHWVNASLGTSALARAALVQAATFVELGSTDQVTGEDVEAALDEARDARDRLEELHFVGADSESAASLAHLLSPLDASISALEDGDFEEAKDILSSEVETAYIEARDSLQAEQDEIQAQIGANTADARRTTDFITFVLMFAIPAAAVLLYRFIGRRALREYQVKANVEIEAERAVSRAKDDFIAGLSHELRTPLTSIYGFAEILTDDRTPDPDSVRELAQIIANESAEMTRMVDDLLAAARLDGTGVEIEMAPTRLSDVIASAVTPFERAGLRIKRSTSDAWVATDAARLRHVLINLLSNAARHGGSNIGIEVSAGEGVVDIEVWDDGAGVPDDKVDKLFERFIHNGSAVLLTGTVGLGLAVASRLTGLLGGKLSYQRFVGKTYFVVSLPALSEVTQLVPEPESVADVVRAMSA